MDGTKIKTTLNDSIYEAIKRFFEVRIQKLTFNYFLEGTIISRNKNGNYQVRINNDIYTLSKLDKDNTTVYQVNDVVYVLVMNNNSSRMYILCRKN